MTGSRRGPDIDGRVRPFLEVRDLRVRFTTDDGVVKAVDGLSFSLERGCRWGSWGSRARGRA